VGKDAIEWAKQCEALGAGVILRPAWMETELSGLRSGIYASHSESVKLPVVASGGAGKLQDFSDAVTQAKQAFCWRLPYSIFGFEHPTGKRISARSRHRSFAIAVSMAICARTIQVIGITVSYRKSNHFRNLVTMELSDSGSDRLKLLAEDLMSRRNSASLHISPSQR